MGATGDAYNYLFVFYNALVFISTKFQTNVCACIQALEIYPITELHIDFHVFSMQQSIVLASNNT